MKFRKYEKKTFTLQDFEKYMKEQESLAGDRAEKVVKPKLRSFPLQAQKDKYDIFTANSVYQGFYSEEFPSLEEELATKVEFDNLTDVEQRFFNQWNQPSSIKELFPK